MTKDFLILVTVISIIIIIACGIFLYRKWESKRATNYYDKFKENDTE
jgi:uncharacterized protein YxeA